MPGVTHSNTPFATNVFVNGGPTLGGGVANALGIEDTVGISDEQARQIISDRADTISAGLDPDTHEALEQFGGGSPNGTNPVSGQEGENVRNSSMSGRLASLQDCEIARL